MHNDIDRIGELETRYVLEVLSGGYRASQGALMMKRLESAFASRFGRKYSIAFSNGTSALHACLAAAGIGYGDEVIVPPLTMSSTAFCVLQANAVPVFADVKRDTFTLDPAAFEAAITPRTKAVIPVALYGLAPEMDEINAIARQHNIRVLEDAAQCFLGEYKGRLVGTLSDMACFSFQSSKHITCGDGGIVLTDDPELALNIRRFGSLGYAGIGAAAGKITKDDIQDPGYQRHLSLGWNYRLPELCSAVALAQTERIDELVLRRQEVARLFKQAVAGCSWLRPQATPPDYVHAYWTFAALLEHPAVSWKEFRKAFRDSGGDGVYAAWKLGYQEPVFRNYAWSGRDRLPAYENSNRQDYRNPLCPVAETLQPRILQFKTNY